MSVKNLLHFRAVTDLLDSLTARHNPSIEHPDYNRWEDYARTYSSKRLLKEFESPAAQLLNPKMSYTVAAYLRFWSHVSNPEYSLKEDLFVWPDGSMWRDGFIMPPEFYITIRSGSKGQLKFQTLGGEIRINAVQRGLSQNSEYQVNNVWGNVGGSLNQYDDKLFDYHLSGIRPIPKKGPGFAGFPNEYRPRDHPGQFAIYPIESVDGSVNLGFGIAIPSGSPEHIRSMRG